MSTDKEVVDSYILNQQYTVKHVSSDYIQMSCYGYHFDKWIDEAGEYLEANQICSFTQTEKSLSALWLKNMYTVNFWREKNAAFSLLYGLSSVEYKDSCDYPEDPTPPEKKRFSKWVINSGAQYQLSDMNSVTCDMDLIAEFMNQWYVNFKYQTEGVTGDVLCTLTCDDGSDVSSSQYPPLNVLQKPLYTVSSFNPISVNNVIADTTVYVQDIANILSARYNNPNFKYNSETHTISVEDYIKTPYHEGEVIIKYADSETDWRTNPISYTNKGTYILSISLSSENYFEKIYEVTATIVDKDAIKFYFKNYFKDGEYIASSDTQVIPYYSVPEDQIPEACDTVSSTFKGWTPVEYLSKPTEISNSVSAVYELKKKKASYFYDDTVPELKGISLGEREVDYGGNAFMMSPNGYDGYTCDGWSTQTTGRYPLTRNIIANADLSVLTQDISAYAFMRRIHPIKAYMVYGDNIFLSTLEGDISTVVDYNYLDSKQIGLSDIQYYEFDKWQPDFDIIGEGKNGSWRIDKDDYSISAIYKAKTGTLTYHSNYPLV